MKVNIINNGKLSLVLIPEEGNELELQALKQLSKQEVEISFREGQTPSIDGNLHDILIVSSKTSK